MPRPKGSKNKTYERKYTERALKDFVEQKKKGWPKGKKRGPRKALTLPIAPTLSTSQERFEQVFAETVAKMKVLLLSKGSDYSDNNDRLSNFKNNSCKLGLRPMQVWAIYFLKHIDAISKYCATEKLASEPIESRFLDALNYLMLGLALIKENDLNK